MGQSESKTILLVEDESIIALHEAMVLKKAGYKVLTAGTGEKAVELASENPDINLVLMDINLGRGIDGTEAAEIILSTRDLPVVFLSSHTEPAVVDKTEKITSYGYVVKSSGETVLLASIKMAFKLHEASIRIKEQQRYLEESEERFRSIVEGAPDPIFIQTEKKFAYVNPAAVRLFGAENASDLLGMPVMERFHPDFHNAVRERIRMLNEERKRVPNLFEQKYIRLDGSEVWVETVGEPITYEGKQGALVFVRDISERKHQEALLIESEERYRSMFENSHAVMLCIDPDNCRIVDANPAAQNFYLLSRKELIGRSIADINTLTPAEVQAEMDKARKSGKYYFEFRHQLGSGEIRDVEVYSGPIKIQGKEMLFSIIHDISEREKKIH